MSKDLITGAEALMRSLEHQGVTTIFGYPGGSIMPVFDALYDHQNTLNHILVRHEQGAAHAAQGFARVSGEVGVCLVTSGPGATNTITGIADAMIDSTPIVVIAGQVGTGFLGTDAFQEVDLVGITQPIAKWSYQIRRAEDVAWAVARAFYIARSGRPGPVVLDFAKDAQNAKTKYEPAKLDFIRSYVPVPDTDEDSVKEAAELINNAERPLVLVGQGVELGNAQSELRAFSKGNSSRITTFSIVPPKFNCAIFFFVFSFGDLRHPLLIDFIFYVIQISLSNGKRLHYRFSSLLHETRLN